MTPFVLASTSIYRKELLHKLGIDFNAIAPICDEDEVKKTVRDPYQLASTLAKMKAESLANKQNCVIGGDQVASLRHDDGSFEILGKPKSKEKAHTQLSKMQGRTHELITALCVIDRGQAYDILNITRLTMRPLTAKQIDFYIDQDQPLDCAGSYKIEKSGLTLMSHIESSDFSAIQGVPLIELCNLLNKIGYQLPPEK